jgi:hypothetical protein
MPNKMPDDIEKMLYELDNHDDIERIQKQWFEYQSANTLYEKQYPLQLGNIVEGNLKFKENKSIPTPAEQMHEFNESIRQELYELHGKGKEQEYYFEIEEPGNDNIQSERTDAMKDFQLTWADASETRQVANDKISQTDKEQDFRLEWDNSPAADNDSYPQDSPLGDRLTQERSDRIQKVEEFKLTFDTMDKEDHQIDSREIEAEREDFEYDDE